MTLRARLTWLAFACLSLWLLGAGVSGAAVHSWARSLDVRRDLLVEANDVSRLRLVLSDQEAAVRGYVITGAQSSLEPYRTGLAGEAPLLVSLENFSSRRDSIALHVRELRSAIDGWRASVAEPAIHGRTGAGGDQAAIFASAGLDARLFAAVRTDLDAVERDVEVVGGRAATGAAAALRRAVVASVATVAAIAVMTIGAAVAVRRWVTRPLKAMTESARRIMAGQPIEMRVDAAVEFRELAAAVDEMKSTISEQRDTALRARESVEQNALLAFHVRRELETSLGEFPPGWTVAAGLRSAEGIVTGDCYEVSLVGPATIALVIIDIAGHGAAHAIAAMKCKELLRVALRAGMPPGDALTWLYQQRPIEEGFLTAFVALVETDRGLCRYANAGHPPPKLATPSAVIDLTPTGPLLGPVDAQWETKTAEIVPGSKLAMYTDGIIEARDAANDFYGEGRLVSILRESGDEKAEPIAKAILDDLRAFTGELRLADDATLIVVCRSVLQFEATTRSPVT